MKNPTKFFEVNVKKTLVRVPGAFPFFEHFVAEELLHISKINDPAARARAVFPLLRVLGGKKYAEIARILGVPPSTVRSWPRNRRVARACRKLESRFIGQFIGRTIFLVKNGDPSILFRELACYPKSLRDSIIFRIEVEADADLAKNPSAERQAAWRKVDQALTVAKFNSLRQEGTLLDEIKHKTFERMSAIENLKSKILAHFVELFENKKISQDDLLVALDGLDTLAGIAREAVADAEHWHVKFVNKGKWGKNAK